MSDAGGAQDGRLTHSAVFAPIHAAERKRLALQPDLRTPDGVGLALSGGGIRSASFALGVLQVLLNEDLLRRIDYLSTVSGGGYLGSAVSWWLHQMASGDGRTPRERYQAFREEFGSKVQGARTAHDPSSGSAQPRLERSNWLAYIRQHGNYLQPPGVGLLSLAATVLRVCLHSILVYLSAVVGIFSLLMYRYGSDMWRCLGLGLAAGFGLLILGTTLLYGPATWIASSFDIFSSSWLYKWRTWFRRSSGTLVAGALAGLILWSVAALDSALQAHAKDLLPFAVSSSGLGAIGSIYQFWLGRAKTAKPSALTPLRIIVTAALVLYGLLFTAYMIAAQPTGERQLELGLIALAIAIIVGFWVNTNYSGLARLYRDRLMEAFLPDPSSAAQNTWKRATQADQQAVDTLGGRLAPDGSLTKVHGHASCQRPLHILNCNVVLLDSEKDIYRTRGGDSFMISSLWSGGNATGWIATPELGDGDVSLATAMSISGAAANPNAAPNGQGVERNKLVAFLMSIFNARLGYWMANPARPNRRRRNRPNFWVPGLRQGLLGRGLHERAQFLELTDGGHFDNTGVYELVRRRSKLIIVSEAGQDADFSMDDLANVIEKVRVDFSVFIEFNEPATDIGGLRPQTARRRGQCERGFAVGRVRYPKGSPTSPEFDDGLIVYLQAVPIAAMPTDVDSYWRRNLEFPNDTTADQFFDEDNLEAYRELGYAIAGQFYSELKAVCPGHGYLGQVADLLRRQ
jgi:hypothetical protein